MLSFGNLQNNLFQLNKYLKKMNGFLQLNVKQLDEK